MFPKLYQTLLRQTTISCIRQSYTGRLLQKRDARHNERLCVPDSLGDMRRCITVGCMLPQG
jgi:hypothetical protein